MEIDLDATDRDDAVSSVEEGHPWQDITVPDGFELGAEGVFRLGRGEPVHISGPVWEVAKTLDHERQVWGMRLNWLDPNGSVREHAFPRALLHESGQGQLVGYLAACGLFIMPGQERALKQYLASFETALRVRSVMQTGWIESEGDQLSFLLPHCTLGNAAREPIVFQPEENSASRESFNSQGTLEDWQNNVGCYLEGNPLLIFNTAVALAGPLLRLVNMDSCGFHLFGASSVGKTTALQVAASVWGNGADPASCSESDLQRWNTTANALEGIAAAHNDIFLALDELGTFGGGDFGNTVYNLMGGRGKARMNKAADLKDRRGWRTTVLSSGEVSIQQRIEQDGQTARAGQLNRMMDITVEQGILDNTHGMDAGTFANHLKNACGQCFGTLGPAFIESLLLNPISNEVLVDRLLNQLDTIEQNLRMAGMTSEQQRAVRRLAVVALAGVLAADAKLLPVTSGAIMAAMRYIRDAWYFANHTEQVRGVLAVRDFIQKHQGSRFHYIGTVSQSSVGEREFAGYFIEKDQAFALTEAGFKEACAGYDPRVVAKELDRQGLLVTNESNRLTFRHSALPGYEGGARPRLYTIKQGILQFESCQPPGTAGTLVQAPVE